MEKYIKQAFCLLLMDKKAVLLAAIFLLGLVFLGRGITGMVVSESCCFPPNCAPENMCDVAGAEQDVREARLSVPVFNTFFVLLGVVLIGIGLVQTFKHKNEDFD
jgi:uncharacterized membrane protein YphA (DoxX/SURF4 family)